MDEGFSTLEEKKDYKFLIWMALIALVVGGLIYTVYKLGSIDVLAPEIPIECVSVSGKDCSTLPYAFRLSIAQSGVGNPDCNCKIVSETFK